jgi:23S rRNA (cytidine1920-2'-O)/16S rRNA (cytidine1409-2'-O)-methyltransferase
MKTQHLLDLLRHRHPELDKKELLARILCGEVQVAAETIRDPKFLISKDSVISFKPPSRFISRGGLKLDHALRVWKLDVRELVFVDAGASSGGFTDCLLQRGARRVYCIDVGYNQLDYSLRKDERVVVLERTNIMAVSRESFHGDLVPDAAVADLSFRSLRSAAGHLITLVTEGWLVALIKPQFEWRTPSADFHGVVRGAERYRDILHALIAELWREGACLSRITGSPVKGRRGNVEFLGLFSREKERSLSSLQNMVDSVISETIPP